MPFQKPQNPLVSRERRMDAGAIVAALVILLAFIWRTLGLRDLEVWRDEALTLVDSSASWPDLILRLPFAEDTPPLNFILYKVWQSLFPTELGARVLPVIAGVATVAVLMAAAARMRAGSGWAVGLLAAFSYEFLNYSQEIRVYSLLVLLTAMCFLSAEQLLALPKSRGWRTTLLICIVVAAHAHAVGLFVFPMILVFLIVRAGWPRTWQAIGLWPMVVWAIFALPMIWFGMHWSRFHRELGNWWNVPPDRTTIDALFHDFSGLMTLRAWSHAGTWHVGPWAGFWLERVVIVGEAMLVCVALLDRSTRRTAVALLAAAFVYAALMTISSYLALPNVVERTALPGWCPLVLVMGLGAVGGHTRNIRLGAGATAVVVCLIWASSWLWLVNSGLPRHDPNAAAYAWMRSRLEPGDLIFSSPEGMQDLTFYRLAGIVSADQLLGTESPVYAGKPARPLIIPRVPDPDWASRLETSIRDRFRDNTSFRIWIVLRGIGDGAMDEKSPEKIVERTHMRVGRFSYVNLRGTTITEYQMRPAASQPAPVSPPVANSAF